MSNMSYCRFRNTRRDLSDCAEALEGLLAGDAEPLSDDELDAAKQLVHKCLDIAQLVGDQIGVDLDDELAVSAIEKNLDEILDGANKETTSSSSC